MNLTYWQLLKTKRNFRNLWWGQFISELGNWFNYVAGVGLIRTITGGEIEYAGILLLIRTLPWSLLTPFAGTLSDRISNKKIMLATETIRFFLALVFIFVEKREDLWIVFVGTFFLSVTSAFFDAAKNSATPNLAGKDGLLSATALMFTNRFLLMALGAALGGFATFYFSYKVAFIINAITFLFSAYSIWLIPEEDMREKETINREKESFSTELKECLDYALKNPFALTILIIYIIWATGGGATLIIFEALGVRVFSNEQFSADLASAYLLVANGIGLTLGMVLAHRVSHIIEIRKIENQYIIWSLFLHGIFFALAGLMGNIWLAMLLIIISRTIVGAEYAVQETLFQRSLPDYIRGRITTLDRGAEITMLSISSLVAAYSLK
ncbi:MAG: MFS transporter [Pyrinomonadaceae bacterium]|nr:MFS transporter [Pyrinomonadaceae bacterium]